MRQGRQGSRMRESDRLRGKMIGHCDGNRRDYEADHEAKDGDEAEAVDVDVDVDAGTG